MISDIFVHHSAAKELAKKLPGLAKHDYDSIDVLMRSVAQKHRLTRRALHNLFVREFKKTPDKWIKSKLDELQVSETSTPDSTNVEEEVQKFIKWAAHRLHLVTLPEIELSMDTAEAQDHHHTGSHTEGDNKVWVYVKNRNLVDILRTVFHELVHVRQSELGMIKPGDSYPGSPIEAMADMLAGKYIKIYGEKNHNIFQ